MAFSCSKDPAFNTFLLSLYYMWQLPWDLKESFPIQKEFTYQYSK